MAEPIEQEWVVVSKKKAPETKTDAKTRHIQQQEADERLIRSTAFMFVGDEEDRLHKAVKYADSVRDQDKAIDAMRTFAVK